MSNHKRFFIKCLIGFVGGILVGLFITVISSLVTNDMKPIFVDPEFAAAIGNTPLAILVQSILSGLLGLVGLGGSEMYRIESWSIAKATLVHFAAVMVVFLAVSFTLRWMSVKDMPAIFIILGVFILVYAIIWLTQYIKGKKQVRDMNSGLEKMKKNRKE